MFADLDRSDGTRDASGLTRLFTQFFGALDKRKPERQQAINVRLLERP
jgi:hypothetical protein